MCTVWSAWEMQFAILRRHSRCATQEERAGLEADQAEFEGLCGERESAEAALMHKQLQVRRCH